MACASKPSRKMTAAHNAATSTWKPPTRCRSISAGTSMVPVSTDIVPPPGSAAADDATGQAVAAALWSRRPAMRNRLLAEAKALQDELARNVRVAQDMRLHLGRGLNRAGQPAPDTARQCGAVGDDCADQRRAHGAAEHRSMRFARIGPLLDLVSFGLQLVGDLQKLRRQLRRVVGSKAAELAGLVSEIVSVGAAV